METQTEKLNQLNNELERQLSKENHHFATIHKLRLFVPKSVKSLNNSRSIYHSFESGDETD